MEGIPKKAKMYPVYLETAYQCVPYDTMWEEKREYMPPGSLWEYTDSDSHRDLGDMYSCGPELFLHSWH